ncbi:SpaA isopeptide-forming pilin-related protein [Streptomyces sp. NPDC047803]|uniref:MSCRAMM family protein n=1 Tax=Streptomyces sp. NPDC047803 TaxID=3160976 RepID=UPI0033C829E1
MHVRLVRPAAVAIAVAGALAWAPAANAQPSEPTPWASAAPAETPAPDAGSVEITTKDTAGDALPGAEFLLLDSSGLEAGRGTTDAHGLVSFADLVPGVYRLKATSSGSPLHDVAADQDVIVTPGATTRLTVTSPFKAAQVHLQVKDDKSGKLLPGATVNIGTGTSTLLTLTTGSKGTASGVLPVSSRATRFWVKQTTAPAGYGLYKPIKTFTAGPGSPVTVTVTNAKTATVPKPSPSDKPTHTPTPTPTTPGRPSSGTGGTVPSAPSTSTRAADAATKTAAETPVDAPAPKAPTGSLAHTGADATPWIATGAGLFVAAGAAALVVARRRTVGGSESESDGKNS